MTPDRRLDQLEPLVADGLQKIDRLIEGQGQILEVATRADQKEDIANQKADITAKAVANLTVNVNQVADQQVAFQEEIRLEFEQVDQKQADFEKVVRLEFQQVNQKFDLIIDLLQQR